MHIYSHRVAIVGITGYAGQELERLLAFHPRIRISGRFSSKDPLTPEKLRDSSPDVVVLATEAELSLKLAPELLDTGHRVIDMSGAFRLRDPKLYPEWYGFEHAAPGLLEEAAYGLPEFFADRIEHARLVANPGCYATAAILPLIPLFREGAIHPSSTVVIDGKSGVSGAGRQPRPETHFCEVNDNISAYRVLRHRHTPEMVSYLPGASLERFVFTPHLIPITRGILNTIVLNTANGASVREVLSDTYARAPFVRLLPEGQLPDVQQVARTNLCLMGVVSQGRNTVIVSAIDNLVKGAAGQVIQNLNLMLGCEACDGFGGMSFIVIKVGGALLEDPARAVEQICRVAAPPFVLVHGGGVQITRMLDRMNVPSKFIDGLRVTDERTLDAVTSALLGSVHTSLVAALCRSGVPAVGMFGAVRAKKKVGPWGFVGTDLQADRIALEAILKAGLVPVIPTLAIGPGTLLNVNGDETAAAVAASLGAFDLVFLTDVEGVQDANGRVFHELAAPDELLRASYVTGGMVPKLRAVKAAMAAGALRVRVGKTVFRRDS